MGQYMIGSSVKPNACAKPEYGSHMPNAMIIPEVRIRETLGMLWINGILFVRMT